MNRIETTIRVTEIEPVKTLVAEVAKVYPELLDLRQGFPKIDAFCKAVEQFRDTIGKGEKASEVPEMRIGNVDRQSESARNYQRHLDPSVLLRVDVKA